jgi:hypothetical protein
MDNEALIDYAHPTMMAEKALKELHNAMLRREFGAAIEHGMTALVEVKMAINAIKHTIETQKQ